MLAIVLDSNERDARRAARTFVLAVAALWIAGAALIDPLARGDDNALVGLELRLLGAGVLAAAVLALRTIATGEVRRWILIGAVGTTVIGLDAVIEILRGPGASAPRDVMLLAVAIALCATAAPRARIGAPVAALWIAAHEGALLATAASTGTPTDTLRSGLANAAIEIIALGLVVAAAHRIWRLHHDLFASRRLGRYRLLSPLGHGMNEVWLAWDEQRRREVALKLLHTPDAAGATRLRFEREAEHVRMLRSPRTVRIYDYGVTDDGFAYMAFEYLRGLDLDALVTAYGSLEPSRAYHLMVEAARGLAVAHARGIVHRDVKPANLHCADSNGSEDFVRILDFGVARSMTDTGLTLDGVVVGTPTYMAPEAFVGGDVTPAADVYALGATFYFALTGQPPFDAEDVATLRGAHLRAPVVPPSLRARREIPRALENVILRCLAKQGEDRYPDAIALVAALEACSTAIAPWSRETAARWWHRARVGRVPQVAPTTERTTEVEAVPLRATPS
ncbi:MAG TPA: serine/threonine-protein kinase [Kofleriaceae bacterium]|nr:serine/threonine-protein kinase [Kofleriaceae bacterium]